MFVVVHSGSRDNYQVALALYERNMLACLVTDYYYQSSGFPCWLHLLLVSLHGGFRGRCHAALPGKFVKHSNAALLFFILAKIFSRHRLLFNRLLELHDYFLALKAKRLSIANSFPILAYSTYAAVSFRGNPNHKILFLMHPYCEWVKNRLLSAYAITPEYKSLITEYEFTVSSFGFSCLVDEPYLADSIICASSCTLNSLPIDATTDKSLLVAPYGSRLDEFSFTLQDSVSSNVLNVLAWGSLSERKRFSAFLTVSRKLRALNFKFHIAYKSIYDHQLCSDLESSEYVTTHYGLSDNSLAGLLSSSQVLFFPSWLEGFGHIILEAMSRGLVPIVSRYTCGPDIIDHGLDGFVLADDSLDRAVEFLLMLEADRRLLNQMRTNAIIKSSRFSESSFRQKITDFLHPIS